MAESPVAIWAVTSHEGHRIDRAGRLLISAIFLPTTEDPAPFKELHDSFNLGDPIDDVERWGAIFQLTLDQYRKIAEHHRQCASLGVEGTVLDDVGFGGASTGQRGKGVRSD